MIKILQFIEPVNSLKKNIEIILVFYALYFAFWIESIEVFEVKSFLLQNLLYRVRI